MRADASTEGPAALRRRALDRITAVVAVAVALPPVLAIATWAAPPASDWLAPRPITVAYACGVGLGLVAWCRLALARIVSVPVERPRRGEAKAMSRLVAVGAAALVAHVLASNVMVLLDSAAGERQAWPPGLALAAAVALQVLLAALPVIVYGYGRLGRLYGPYLRGRPAVPFGSRLVVMGLVLPVVAAAVVPVHQMRSGAGLDAESWLVWLGVCVYVVVLFAIVYQNQKRSLEPLQRLLETNDADALEAAAATSLDDLGVSVNRLRQLLARQLQAERALAESEIRTRMFADAASDYLYEMDEQLRFTFVSERFTELTGIPVTLLIGQSATELGRAHITEQRQTHVEDLLAHRPYRDYRFSVPTRDGRLRHFQLRGLPFFDDDGRFLGYRGAGTDVTDVVEAQQRLLRTESELSQAQNMKSLGQLTGTVAHDFNNVLTTLIGSLELAIAQAAPSVRRHLEAALGEAEEGSLLVQRLLSFSRRQSMQPSAVDVVEVLGSLAPVLKPLLAGVKFSVPAQRGEAVAFTDAAQLKQALLHLLVNAREATPDGGRICVTTETVTVTADELPELAPGDYLRIDIADTGGGIHPDHVMFVFEPFFTTKAPGQGTGLGLSMVYGFASQSGGLVRIQSACEGTRVELFLPRAPSADAAARPAAAPLAPRAVQGARLLVVEDDPQLSRVVCQLLGDLGYEVAGVGSGEAAVGYLDANPDVALVLCDVMLPGSLSGLDVVRSTRERGHSCRWLLMSGHVQADAHLQGAEMANVGILRKPFRSRELGEQVAAAMAMTQPW